MIMLMFWRIKSILIGCFAMVAQPLLGQPLVLDSLFAAFAAAKTDSAKLATAFVIMDELGHERHDERKSWLDTTAQAAQRLASQTIGVEWKLHLADWHHGLGDMENSYRISMDCASRFRVLGDSTLACRSLFMAGTALSEFNPTAAIEVMEEAVALARSLRHDGLIARCLTNLAYALQMADLNTTERYRDALDAALKVFIEMKDIEGILISNFSLVEYYSAQGQFERARQRIGEMQHYLVGSDDEVSLAFPIVAEANVLRAEGKLEAALPKFEYGFDLMRKHGIWDGQWELYPVMIDVYKKTGRYEKAVSFMEAYEVMKDSIISLEKNKTVQNLQTRYETEKKEAQIVAQQADIARSRKEKWALATGLALLGGLSFLFWRQRRKTQVANLELASSNEQIAQKNQKLDLLMRELHHRVKNNLQLVSSLLRLQSRQVGDESAAAAIKAGQLRVEAMSLIHQRLYREEGITLVNMQEFAHDLVEKIAFAFGHRLDEMDVSIDFQPNELDVDKAMPISLILNELLTNSFKYAYGNVPHPAIHISLSPQDGKLRLHYADNGLGLPEASAPSSSFGSKLIASLSSQLGGSARQWNDGGAHFEVLF